MTLLTIVRRAALRVGVQPPAQVVGNTDLQVQQLLDLAQEEAEQLAKRSNWTKLITPGVFTTVATMEQPGVLTEEFQRFSPGITMWWQEQYRPIRGPLNAQEWLAAISRPVSPALWGYWRVIGGVLNLWPIPAAGQLINWEWQSKEWCVHTTGPNGHEWTADDDTSLTSEELIRLGVIWRWLQMKGLDYAEALRTYEIQVEQDAAQDGGMKDVQMNMPRRNWPDGFLWSQTITIP